MCCRHRSVLEWFGLGQYVDRFEVEGYDDVEFLLNMTDAQVDTMLEHVGMKIGHAVKFRAAYYKEKKRQECLQSSLTIKKPTH